MEDIYFNILLHTNIQTIGRFSQTSSMTNKITQSELLWKHMYTKIFNNYCLHDNYYNTCKNLRNDIKFNNFTNEINLIRNH